MITESTFLSIQEKKRNESIGLIHRVYLSSLKNSKKYTASTKTKSEVRGGGRKPWKQKGTGRARAGSLRSPLFVGGGVIFGPQPRFVLKKINKKEKRLAILSALSLKQADCFFIEEQQLDNFQEIKTQAILTLLKKFNLEKKNRILFVLNKPNRSFWLSSKNLRSIEVTTATSLNLQQILKANCIVLSKLALNQINLTYGTSST
jgi:large subunit ribosomal protein L4